MTDTNEILQSVLDELRYANGRAVPRQAPELANVPIAEIDVSSALTNFLVKIPPSTAISFLSIPASLTAFGIRIGDPRGPLLDMLTIGRTLRWPAPITEMFITTVGGGAGDVVQYVPGISLDVRGNPAVIGAGAGHPYGRMIALEHGTVIRTAVATETHTWALPDAAGVPAGQIHVYNEISLRILAAAAREATAYVQNALTNYYGQVIRNVGYYSQNLGFTYQTPVSFQMNAGGVLQAGRPVILYPGDILRVVITALLNTESSRISFSRERYATPLTMIDVSAEPDVVVT